MNREEIKLQIKSNIEKIEELQSANKKLITEDYLFSDEKQWFTEKMESIIKRDGNKKVKADWLIGCINWISHFTDADTGKVIPIERSKIVRINGEWNF